MPPALTACVSFLAWLDEDTRAEWVDGEVILLGPASLRHQEVSGFLHAVLSAFVDERGLGTVLRRASRS